MLKLTIDQVNELASELTIEEVTNLPEAITLSMAMQRPGHAGQYGFMVNPSYFKDKDKFAKIMFALMERFGKIKDKEKKMVAQSHPERSSLVI